MSAFLRRSTTTWRVFLAQGIDFKIVVDTLDDSIFITDKDGVCLYVNPAHQRNTTILPEEVLGRKVSDIVAEGTLFTGGATLDVIKKPEEELSVCPRCRKRIPLP